MDIDRSFMRKALKEAALAYEKQEVPVGAVIVRDGEVLAQAHNLRETNQSATAHAELLAVEDACRKLASRRLSGCTLYVTLEPCPMCAGALAAARIDRIVFGAKDARAGACGSLLDLFAYPLESRPQITGGVLESECVSLLQTFFAKQRKNHK